MPLLLGEEQWLKTLRETETGAATCIAIEVAGQRNCWQKILCGRKFSPPRKIFGGEKGEVAKISGNLWENKRKSKIQEKIR